MPAALFKDMSTYVPLKGAHYLHIQCSAGRQQAMQRRQDKKKYQDNLKIQTFNLNEHSLQ